MSSLTFVPVNGLKVVGTEAFSSTNGCFGGLSIRRGKTRVLAFPRSIGRVPPRVQSRVSSFHQRPTSRCATDDKSTSPACVFWLFANSILRDVHTPIAIKSVRRKKQEM